MYKDNNTFHETQRMRWVIYILFGIMTLTLLFQLTTWSTHKNSILEIILPSSITLLLSIFFYVIQLETTINTTHITVRFFPFIWKPRIIYLHEIETIEVKEISNLFEFGGWGYRGTKHNRAYTTTGNSGLQLLLKNGDKLFISTQKKEELENYIEKITPFS